MHTSAKTSWRPPVRRVLSRPPARTGPRQVPRPGQACSALDCAARAQRQGRRGSGKRGAHRASRDWSL